MGQTGDKRLPAATGSTSQSVVARVLAYFGAPAVTAITAVATIASAIFGVATYSKPNRLLALQANPVETVIVKAGATSRLGATFDDQPVDSDITAQQVAFWNDGNLSIRPENVLSPIDIDVQGPRFSK